MGVMKFDILIGLALNRNVISKLLCSKYNRQFCAGPEVKSKLYENTEVRYENLVQSVPLCFF